MSTENKKVSVIMGIYNCAATLPESIESIMGQTYDNVELVMCDDGSTDDTYNVAEEYRAKYPERIKLLRHDANLYLSKSLNDCIAASDGFYIARMDGDDISVPDRIEKQVAFLESHPDMQLVSTAMDVFNELGESHILAREPFPDKYSLKYGTCFNHATILTYRTVYEKLGGYTVSKRTRRGQDYDLWFRFYAAGFKGANMQEPLYRCREDMSAFKRRTFISRYRGFRTRMKGFRMLHYPLRWYYLPFKELAKGFVPTKLAYKLRRTENK